MNDLLTELLKLDLLLLEMEAEVNTMDGMTNEQILQ
jgi:hypothetical protein